MVTEPTGPAGGSDESPAQHAARQAAKHATFDELAVVGKAFGAAKRLELVDLLAQGERGVEELARVAGMGVSTVSAHLQVLRLADLVATRREGTRVLYRLAGEDVAELYAAFLRVARTRSADVERARSAYLELPSSGDDDVVTRQQLQAMLDSGRVTLIDVRPAEEFAAGHIPGARSVPLERLAADSARLRGVEPAELVAYCRGSFCVMAHDAVRLLGAEGVAARRLEDGMLEWRTSGGPVQAGAS